jgi:thiamine-phosphate pyrophosphorylase
MGRDTKSPLAGIASRSARIFPGMPHRHGWPPLLVMTDHTAQGPAVDILGALPPGTILCLRDYEMPDRHIYAAALATRCHAAGIRLLVGGDFRLAHAVRAWGVHVPEGLWRRSRRQVLKARQQGLIVTTSVHSELAARRVESAGPARADAVMVSPVFTTRSHPGAQTLGPVKLACILTTLGNMPAYALGGMHTGTIARLSPLARCYPNLVGVAGIRFTA